MKLPYANAAIIPAEKVRDYLLSTIHPIGRYKAAFFRSYGYEQDNWRTLARDIRALLSLEANDTTFVQQSIFGEKYTVTGQITGPNGRRFGLTTVWIILSGEYAPRLVTAYPED